MIKKIRIGKDQKKNRKMWRKIIKFQTKQKIIWKYAEVNINFHKSINLYKFYELSNLIIR